MSSFKDGNSAPSYSTMSGTLDTRLLTALSVMGFEKMTPVQHLVLTKLPSFQSDCLVQAKTGTGKTAAFLLPTLHALLNSPNPLPVGQVGILVISPTRELALQIANECDQLTSQLGRNYLECHLAFGGTARARNLDKFLKGSPSILVATPGRLKDYLSESRIALKFANLRSFVLDEADTMLESGFLADVKHILTLLPPKSAGWQGMCFSATVPAKTMEVIECVLAPGYTTLSTIDKNSVPTIERVPQFHVIMPSVTDTFNVLASLLSHELTSHSKVIVFGVTANIVALFSNLFARCLTTLHIFELHSRLSQNVRTRTTDEFKTVGSGLMFASDVIGRGMDFPDVDLVIQVGIPSSADQYIHRVGRTGRAGKTGQAIILLTEPEAFFLRANRHLPILPHAQTTVIVNDAGTQAPQIERAMNEIDDTIKQRAYSSFLGYFAGSGLLKPLRMDKAGLVRMVNAWAIQGMHCPEPPIMEKKIIGKMGLKGVPGFNYGHGEADRVKIQTVRQAPRRPRPTTKESSNGSRDQLGPKPTSLGVVKKKPHHDRRRGGRAGSGLNK